MKAISFSIITLIVFSVFVSCKKEYDIPPVKTPESSPAITIKQIKAKFLGEDLVYRFVADSSLYCTVTADETSGNLYKTIYVQDSTGAIAIKLNYGSNGRLFIGDNIRINLKGTTLNDYGSVIQLDSVDMDKHIIKQSSGNVVTPLTVSIDDIIANSAATNTLQSRLVKLENVEFTEADRNIPYADAIGKATKERTLRSCKGSTMTVRSSGFANFAGSKTPNGNGSFICIVSQYRSTPSSRTYFQLTLRNPVNDVNMNGTLCNNGGGGVVTETVTIPVVKDFSDNDVTSGGWVNVNVSGAANWVTSSAGTVSTKPYIQVSGYSGGNQVSEAWYISPAIDLSTSVNPVLSFQNAYNYSGNPLKCYVSTDYTLGNPNNATWTELSFTRSLGNWAFVSSGTVPLSNYKTNRTRIAFKYTSTTSGASTWELDDIVIKEE
ncbi:MAG: choice-of-anchor J domain-containing protein [Bacteroidetes bacterium]|nr:choice-of-anchor J domain-containing protein [Bacteroidota bacterium]